MAEQHDGSESSSGPDKPETETRAIERAEVEASGEDEVVHEPDAISATPPKRKKKKRAVDAAPEPIKDRNRRLREEAAGKRRTQLEERRAPVRSLEAGEIVDDALARSTAAVGEWLKKNFNVVQWFLIAGIVAWVGYAIYSYRAGKAAELASAKLTTAIRAEDARIGSVDTKPDPQTGIVDTRPTYPTNVDRLKAAEAQYRAIADSSSQSTAASFAKLGLASVLYDQGKFADAKAAYQSVKDSKLAAQDTNVRGRALEGIGISEESLGNKDAAQKAFGELANIDGFGFGALGSYHKARLAYAAGESDKAKDLLKDAQKQLDAATDQGEKKTLGNPGYLEMSVRDLLRRIDPSAVTTAPNSLTAEQIQELQEQMGSPSDGPGKGMSKEKINELLKHMSQQQKPAAPPASAP